MSHFSVCVVGKDPEYELAPFHEFECTGMDDEFVQDVDFTKEVQERMEKEGEDVQGALDWWGLKDRMVESEAELDRVNIHKYGYALVTGKTLVKAVKRTNPNKRWDWWRIGGRWSDKLLLRNGSRCNSSPKGDVDFDAMRFEAERDAKDEWTQVHALIDPLPPVVPWTVVREDKFPGNIDAARKFYGEQEVVKAVRDWNKANDYKLGPFDEFEPFLVPLAQYVQIKGDESFSCFAFLKDRHWAERGEMGWWACVHNEKDQQTWNSIFRQLLEGVKDDEQLTVVDCHI